MDLAAVIRIALRALARNKLRSGLAMLGISIGVLAPKGQSPIGQDQDDVVLMPFTTVQKKIKGISWLDDIMCSAISPEVIAPAEEEIAALLRERHPWTAVA